jgi:hypothetical protein
VYVLEYHTHIRVLHDHTRGMMTKLIEELRREQQHMVDFATGVV